MIDYNDTNNNDQMKSDQWYMYCQSMTKQQFLWKFHLTYP